MTGPLKGARTALVCLVSPYPRTSEKSAGSGERKGGTRGEDLQNVCVCCVFSPKSCAPEFVLGVSEGETIRRQCTSQLAREQSRQHQLREGGPPCFALGRHHASLVSSPALEAAAAWVGHSSMQYIVLLPSCRSALLQSYAAQATPLSNAHMLPLPACPMDRLWESECVRGMHVQCADGARGSATTRKSSIGGCLLGAS
jgi:hypothetical protein